MDDVHRAGTGQIARFTLGRGRVGRRRVHDGGLRHPAVQQLEREGSDPAADIQHVTARGAGGDDAVAQETSRRSRALLLVALQLPGRQLLGELPVSDVTVAGAAGRHGNLSRREYWND